MVSVLRHHTAFRSLANCACFEGARNKRQRMALNVAHGDPLPPSLTTKSFPETIWRRAELSLTLLLIFFRSSWERVIAGRSNSTVLFRNFRRCHCAPGVTSIGGRTRCSREKHGKRVSKIRGWRRTRGSRKGCQNREKWGGGGGMDIQIAIIRV